MSSRQLASVICMLVGVCLLAWRPAAQAQDAAGLLQQANAAGQQGDWATAGQLAATASSLARTKSDRAEAHRVLGLAAFFSQDLPRAEQEFLAYLRLELDGRLDPALVAPEAVTFFESVRARNAALLRSLRPRQKRYWALNLVPPMGQIQNKKKTKAIVLGSLLGVATTANLVSFGLLNKWCNGQACDDGGDHYADARTARTINIVGGVFAITTYAVAVADGLIDYHKQSRSMQLGVVADGERSLFLVGGRF